MGTRKIKKINKKLQTQNEKLTIKSLVVFSIRTRFQSFPYLFALFLCYGFKHLKIKGAEEKQK